MKTYVLIYFKFSKLRNKSFIEYFFMKIEIPTSGHILYALSCILGFRGGVEGPDSISVDIIGEGIQRVLYE